MKPVLAPWLAASALLGLACGGGASLSGPSFGTQLVYSNPANRGGQFALVLDSAASTPSLLVLDLVGPEFPGSPIPGCGVTFGFNLDTTRATWSSTPVTGGSLFHGLVQGWADGTSLQGISANKGLASPVNDIGSGVIAKVLLVPIKGAPRGYVSLADNGLGTFLDSNGTLYSFPIRVGVLNLQ